jgi:hypothetical protein
MSFARSSFQKYATLPSAIISDGLLPIPIWAVTMMKLDEAYALPAIGSTGAKAIVSTHDDTITLTGVLVGPERFAWKFSLETLAETSKRGGALEAFTGGAVSGLVLITSMTIRTDLQVKSLSFTASDKKRDVLDLSIALEYMPRPSALGKLLDVASIGVGALTDWAGN